MTAVQPFDFQGHQVRVVTDEHGEPWFVASDVARILGYAVAKDMTRRLDDDDKGGRSVPTPGGTQQMTVITEAGLYVAVLGSQVSGARAFKRWVTHDVLPAIRRTGSYSTGQQVALPTTRELALMVIEAEDARLAAEARVAELEPVAQVAQRVMDATGDFSLREAAQALSRDHGIDTGQNRLMKELVKLGWVDLSGQPYQRRIQSGHMKVLLRTYDHPHTGEPKVSTQVRITGKGVVALATALRPSEFPPLTAV